MQEQLSIWILIKAIEVTQQLNCWFTRATEEESADSRSVCRSRRTTWKIYSMRSSIHHAMYDMTVHANIFALFRIHLKKYCLQIGQFLFVEFYKLFLISFVAVNWHRVVLDFNQFKSKCEQFVELEISFWKKPWVTPQFRPVRRRFKYVSRPFARWRCGIGS